MAVPIIDSMTVEPSKIAPGGTAKVTIDARDPDSTSGTLTGTVTDAAGNTAQATATLTIEDVLTYALEDTDLVGFTIVQDPALPNVFHVTAP